MLSYAPTGLIVPDGEGNFKGGQRMQWVYFSLGCADVRSDMALDCGRAAVDAAGTS